MNRTRNFYILFILLFIGCTTTQKPAKLIDLQGHRGCRGVLPENTQQAFNKALSLGVTTLEMDLCISKDSLVVISHDPFFSHEISTAPDGTEITKANEKQHKLFRLNYNEIKKYDVGLKSHPRFPKQKKIKATKPLFADVVSTIEKRVANQNLKKPYYNAEIKSMPQNDNIFHPDVKTYARLVLKEIEKAGIKKRVCIQSFDIRALQEIKSLAPEMTTALLIENKKSAAENLEKLGFTPDIYSPDFSLVNKNLVNFCQKKNMLLIPWTVNKKKDIIAMLKMGVNGIISDYPEKTKQIIETNGFEVK